ncbi:hypothetical protein J6590_035209 [Homalodisca vitripennis]|nr:hypothetical protein J6590_035209 [Homalodisca vitripennis]
MYRTSCSCGVKLWKLQFSHIPGDAAPPPMFSRCGIRPRPQTWEHEWSWRHGGLPCRHGSVNSAILPCRAER